MRCDRVSRAVGLRVSSSIFTLALAAFAPGSAHAQTQDAPPAEEPAEAAAEDVVVTGFRQSYADEVRTKRNTIEITDGISSDDLGRIPDLNIGEALQ